MAVEIIMPKLGVDMQEGEIIEWKKQEGDEVKEGEILLEIMSDKTNMEIEAEDSGVLLKIVKVNGQDVPVTEVIGYIGQAGEVLEIADVPAVPKENSAAPAEKTKAMSSPTVAAAPQGKIRATPAARKAARDLGVNLNQVSGTGAKGRVHKEDVESFKAAQPKATPLARKIAID